MVIPAGIQHGDERGAGLNETTRQQGALAPTVTPILVAQPRILRVDVERLARDRAAAELVRLAGGLVRRLRFGQAVALTPWACAVRDQPWSVLAAAKTHPPCS